MIGGKELTDSPLLGGRNGMCGGGKKKKAEQDPSVVHSSCCARGFVRFLDACRVVGAHCSSYSYGFFLLLSEKKNT